MPNWCWTRITINADRNRLKSFENKLTEWTSKNYKENGFGLNWLGNVVGNSQIGTVDENKDTDLRCRGSITYTDNLGDQFVIDTETAWAPMLKMWAKLVEKYIPNAELIYTAEESGCALYSTNDLQYKDKYIIDPWDIDDMEPDYEASKELVVSVLQDLLNTTETDIDNLLDLLSLSSYSDKIGIHAWEFQEIDVWE